MSVRILVVLATCLSPNAATLWAKPPEAPPPYSNTRALREDATLRAVAFGDTLVGVAVGDRGVILSTEDGGDTWAVRQCPYDCQLTDCVWVSRRRVIAVGGDYDRVTCISRGVVLISEDAGVSWRIAGGNELPKLNSIERRSDGLLLAKGDWSDSLLTSTFVSADNGQQWRGDSGAGDQPPPNRHGVSTQLLSWSRATSLAGGIRDACKVDESSICAVGDHGTIFVSHDAGKTWTAKRGQNRGTAILIIAEEPNSVAWSLLGTEALEYHNRVALLVRNPQKDEGIISQVATMLGASGADHLATESAIPRTTAEWVAIHQPTVVVLDSQLPHAVQEAFLKAATDTGCARVAVYALSNSDASRRRDTLLAKSGILASDLACDAAHYVAPAWLPLAATTLQYIYDAAISEGRSPSVVSGLKTHPGQKLAAIFHAASQRQLSVVQARLRHKEKVRRLIDDSPTVKEFSQSLTSLLDQTATEDQFRLAWLILQTVSRDVAGARRAALENVLLTELGTRFSDSSIGLWSTHQVQARANSLEWHRLRRSLTGQSFSPAAVTALAVPVSPFQIPETDVRQASAITPILVPEPDKYVLNQKPQKKAAVDLGWEVHPLVVVSREAARQRGDEGGLQEASPSSASLERLASAGQRGWAALLQKTGPRVLAVQRTTSRPVLDGAINDPCWQVAQPSDGPHALRVAYDAEYVYFAFICPSDLLKNDPQLNEDTASLRDQDLSNADRLFLKLDIDRDLATSMQLQVSESGRTHDAIDGNPIWQPTWYVDTVRRDNWVSVELAVVRRDLVDLPILPGESWFVSAQILRAGVAKPSTVIPNPDQWLRLDFQ